MSEASSFLVNSIIIVLILLMPLSQCQHIRALDVFFDGIQIDPVEIAVVGCGCSVATGPVAEISHRWYIPQV